MYIYQTKVNAIFILYTIKTKTSSTSAGLNIDFAITVFGSTPKAPETIACGFHKQNLDFQEVIYTAKNTCL